MPTPEYVELVTVVTETIEQVLTADGMNPSALDQLRNAPNGAAGHAPAYLFDVEKIVWHYPDAPTRLIEE